MSGYIPLIEYFIDFDGDKVKVQLRPLTKRAFVALTATNADPGQRYESACSILNDHIVDVTGLRDANGNAVTKEQILDAVYFKDLVAHLIAELVTRAGLGKEMSQPLGSRSQESTMAR